VETGMTMHSSDAEERKSSVLATLKSRRSFLAVAAVGPLTAACAGSGVGCGGQPTQAERDACWARVNERQAKQRQLRKNAGR